MFAKLPISGEVQIKPGEKFIHFTVVIADDTVPEANETLVIILTAADRGTSIVGAGKLNVSIIDNGKKAKKYENRSVNKLKYLLIFNTTNFKKSTNFKKCNLYLIV